MDKRKKLLLICSSKVVLDIVLECNNNRYEIIIAENENESNLLIKKHSKNIEVIILDIDMWWVNIDKILEEPGMNALRRCGGFIGVCREERADVTLECLKKGAVDVIPITGSRQLICKRMDNILNMMEMYSRVLKDSLTHLYNREAFENKVTELLNENKGSFAFIMIDLDDFKHLNDTMGHNTGDEILTETAHNLQLVFGDYAVIGRMGGDEFAVFVSAAWSKDIIMKKVDEIHELLKMEVFREEKHVEVTSSIGVAFSPEDGIGFRELYERADEAQYKSKQCGKNSVTVYDKIDFEEHYHKKTEC